MDLVPVWVLVGSWILQPVAVDNICPLGHRFVAVAHQRGELVARGVFPRRVLVDLCPVTRLPGCPAPPHVPKGVPRARRGAVVCGGGAGRAQRVPDEALRAGLDGRVPPVAGRREGDARFDGRGRGVGGGVGAEDARGGGVGEAAAELEGADRGDGVGLMS